MTETVFTCVVPPRTLRGCSHDVGSGRRAPN